MTTFTMCCFLLLIWSFVLEAEALVEDIDVTPPVCRVVSESLDCPVPCWDGWWEVTLLMTDGNGTGIKYPHTSYKITDKLFNQTFFNFLPAKTDENGYNVTLINFVASCCDTNVEISAVDNANNAGRCNFTIRTPSTTRAPQTSSSPYNSSGTISLWASLLLLALVNF